MNDPILVLEDEPAMRLLVQDYLEMLGYRVVPAADGATALELFSRERYSLAFVDINLPDIAGDEVMRRIRARGDKTPLVVLSGNLRESYAGRIADLKVHEILEKPIDLQEIERVVREVLLKED